MSKMLPQASVDAFRKQVNVTLDMYGIDTTLYIPSNRSVTAIEQLDIYEVPEVDLDYVQYSTTVFIEWAVTTWRLKKLGLYTEHALPIVAWFPNEATRASDSVLVDIDIIRESYFTISQQFVPDQYGETSSFEIINVGIKGMHDAVIRKAYNIAPRRGEE